MSRPPAGVRWLDGPAGLAAVAPYYDALVGAAPITARWAWLSTWARTHPDWCPLTVVVDGPDGPDGIALLVRRRRGPLLEVTALGHGQSDYARFPVRAPGTVPVLADAISSAIRRLPGPRRVRLDGFAPDDPVPERVAQVLPGAVLLGGDGAPVITLTSGGDPLAGRREARVMARRGHNRLRTDGRAVRIDVMASAEDVAAQLPELERLHRTRDHAVRGHSDLDDTGDRAFWYAICAETARRGELELSTLRVDEELAAYLIAFRDGTAYRVWDPRISPAHARYNPGHVLRADVLARVAASGEFTVFDWMRGVERYKLTTTSTVVETRRLLGWSPAWLHRLEPALRTARARLGGGTAEGRPDRPADARSGPAPGSTLPPAPSRSGLLAELAERAVSAPALVVGSLPPTGRDLDLLVTDEEHTRLATALHSAGFTASSAGWLRWVRADDRVRADVVELLTVDQWGLDPAEHDWMLSGAIPLPGHRMLRRPAPAVALLILARRYAGAGGVLPATWSERVRNAVQEDPRAWEAAGAHARAWNVGIALPVLRAHVAGNPPSTTVRRRLAREGIDDMSVPYRARALALRVAGRVLGGGRARRPAVVALSGLDGAGKTSQAALLVSALQDLGLCAVPGWSRLAYRQWMWNLDRPLAAVARLARRPEAPPAGPGVGPAAQFRPHRELRQRHPSLTWVWAWVVTLDAVMAQRRLLRSHRDVDVVACDRYGLDSAVHLHAAYGGTVDVGLHAAAVRALLPRPLAAFLLRLEPTAAHARKPDDEHSVEHLGRQARLYEEQAPRHRPTVVLDGNRPAAELAEQIAAHVHAAWAAGRPHRDRPVSGRGHALLRARRQA